MTSAPVLTVEHLSTGFARGGSPRDVVHDVSFEVPVGGTLVVLGESGSGKSVTVRSILGLYGRRAFHTGSVRLDGAEILGTATRRLLGRRMSLVPQDPAGALDPMRSIGAQIREVLRVHGIAESRGDARRRAVELLRTVGIPDPEHAARRRQHELSGGMRQRAVIALAVACEPDLLFADEPTSALDVSVQAQILGLFTGLRDQLGTALVVVTHDVAVAAALGGDIAVMYAGRIVEHGPTQDVLTRPSHPYTAGLLASIPRPGTPRGQLPALPGRPPAPGLRSTGCAFVPRCSSARPECGESVPQLVTVAPGHSAACPVTARRVKEVIR
ncbi:ABC transporter ATP-binding protein (plasmid) [Streptomycetaceae bacterium NBC_01309]